MKADRKWVERNLGFDPIERPAPDSTFAISEAARSRSVEDLQREIIDFDSEGMEGREFLAFTTATGLSRFTDVPWPSKLKADNRRHCPHRQRRRTSDCGRPGGYLDRG